jgi:23S rRNA pseudouridine2457 synthase
MDQTYYLLHKPFGYLSQFISNQNTRRKQKFLGELADFKEGTMAVGRLDQDSEGLILLTTDGKFSEFIRSKTIEKEYYVQIDGIPTESELDKLREGVAIPDQGEFHQCLPAKVKLLDPQPNFPKRIKPVRDDRHGPSIWISVIVNEGMFRQVRKMTAVIGFPTLRLIRVRVGGFYLNDLKPGESQRITEQELKDIAYWK